MAQTPEPKLVTPASLALDAVLVVAFFAFLFTRLRIHVPSDDPRMINLWAAITALCLSGVFWLALQMVRVVFRFQRTTRRTDPGSR